MTSYAITQEASEAIKELNQPFESEAKECEGLIHYFDRKDDGKVFIKCRCGKMKRKQMV